MEYKHRKHPRLKNYDYSSNGVYFVTVCVKNRMPLLGEISVDERGILFTDVRLTEFGEIAKQYIERINVVYDAVCVDKYVIMPDHIHLLIKIYRENINEQAVDLKTVVRSFKTLTTKCLGESIWQTSFYERIIRNAQEYRETVEYIIKNPAKWLLEKQ